MTYRKAETDDRDEIINERTLKAQIIYMLLGQQLTILIDTLSAHPKTLD
jgi:hypothetical protein